ncbi:uncharacterized protein EAF01_002973 [Botrytis porri]|uniref:2EXR domain-containing protein n=1 Tax=Botrytis porri TaxID=87229 RepID=A0A4Z1KDJ1_9HELO|nr:uncharacterized protein EAF01_002973 [Botrytis porri]KAF7911466.1 hypothetical protein EAF01_002973 [Botrytis porri]TGO82282.1 hypothetical protein BPOR_0872g00030 [Botrytis porri]
MNSENASDESAADQVATLATPQQMKISTSSTQHHDRNDNEQNHAPVIESAPDTFQRFRNLPTELRLRIWKFAGLQPRVIHVTTYNDTWPENVYLCPTMPQQCPLTMTCMESRDVVLKFKKPLQGLVLRSKTYIENSERRGPYQPDTEYDSRIFGQVEAEMLMGGNEMRGSLEDIHEAYKKGFDDSRNFTIRCFQQDLVKSGHLDDKDQRELQRLLAWEPPKIEYIKESQINDSL